MTNPLRFRVMRPVLEDFARKTSRMGLTYLYLRNTVHVERLSRADLDVFFANLSNPDWATDAALMQIVRDTWQKVIRCDDTDDPTLTVSYDGVGTRNQGFVLNGTIVISVAWSMNYDEHGNLIDMDLDVERLRWIQQTILPQIDQPESALGVPVAAYTAIS